VFREYSKNGQRIFEKWSKNGQKILGSDLSQIFFNALLGSIFHFVVF